MGLCIGIAGLPNVGKSTLLNALTHAGAEASNYPFCTIEQNVGIAVVPDPDLRGLQDLLVPQRVVPSTIRFVDVAGLVQGASRGEGLGNQFLGHLRQTDAILHVVRCFHDPNVSHTPGEPDPLRDAEIVETEFLLADLETAERSLERWRRAAKGGHEGKEEVELYERVTGALAAGRQLTDLGLSERELQILDETPFLTVKPSLYVANTGEDDPRGHGPLVRRLAEAKGASRVLPVSIRIEEEISQLAPEEQRAFLGDLGLERTALDLVNRASYELLDLLTFYTIAHDTVQAWPLRRGSTARSAAGKIHTDMERGFIRAEVMALADLRAWGSRQALHDHGLIHVVGRDYVVQDKDILQIHFKI